MFSSFFGSDRVTDETKSEIIRNVYSQNTNKVISIINHHNINLDDRNLVDESQQNLLHLAVRTKNVELAKFLMSHNINRQKQNIFNEIPLDIAIKNHDKKMVETLLHVEPPIILPYHNTDKLTEELNTEKRNCKRHRDECDTLSRENTSLKNENTDLVIENGKLKTENKKLKTDNDELQRTVKTLRESFKKK